LILAIVSLHITQHTAKKSVLVVINISVFALSLALLTSARRAEIDSAAAAYAAALVVFVSGSLGAG
jgi:hypothetical protein